MSTRMQQRRGTAAQWISTNSGNGPILAAGEIGFESDNNRFKIGDGVNHWVDLPYFANNEAIGDLIDGAPDLLNTLNELAAAINDDPTFFTTVSNEVSALAADLFDHAGETTNIHGIADAAELATMSYVDSAVSNSTVDQSGLAGTGIDWNAGTEQFDIDGTIATVDYVDNEIGAHVGYTTSVHGIADTAALATKTYADDAVSTHSSDTTSVHGIADTSALATKTFAANLLLEATKTNISITGDIDGLTISAENGVADSDTDDLAEGTNHLYFTDERAQDAVGNLVGTGLTYTDATGEIAVDTAVIQERVANVSDTEIGYLNGVTSSVQTQLDAKSTDLSNHNLDTTDVHGIADTSLLALKSEVEAVTATTLGLGNVDNTSDANKPVSTATQTALDAKLSKSGGVMTGALELYGAPTADLHAATKLYVDNIATGLNFHAAVHFATSTNITTDYSNGTDGLGATLTAMSNGPIGSIDGHQAVLNDRVLVKAQTNAVQNGIYYVSNAGSAGSKWVLTRALDADNSPTGEIQNGDFCFVQNGTLAGGSGYIVTTTGTIAIGTTEINYTQFNSGQAVIAGNGLVESAPGIIEIDTAVTQTRVANVSDTEIGYLNGVTSDIQTQIDSKQAIVSGVSDTEIGYLDGVTSAIQTQLNSKASSLAVINDETASYTLVLSDKDKVVEMNVGSANTITVSPDSTSDFPIGTQIDILQVGSGQTTVVAGSGVTINATPGLKLRTQWAGATLRKRAANTWVLVGDLTA